MVKPIHDVTNVLLLQGPMGRFFFRFAKHLEAQGKSVWKINLNGGGWFYSRGLKVLNYRGTLTAWPAYLQDVLQTRRIDAIYLFGDCRRYHREAIAVAKAAGVRVFVFEEGYVRPDYITLEESGVNGYSSLPRRAAFYLNQRLSRQKPQPATTNFSHMAWSAMGYYLAGALLHPFFPHYEHHRNFSVLTKGFIWVRSGWRKLLYNRRDARLTQRLADKLSGKYFLGILQVHCDAQVKFHSPYADVREFIQEVVASFAQHAQADAMLVLKHHPMDRGARHYGQLINCLCTRYNVAGRIIYTHQIHLPTAMDHARGVVLINSTVGLSALLHRTPVKALGDAIYNFEGMTCQRPLTEFWRSPGTVNQRLVKAFRRYVINTTQLNGSFYGLDPFGAHNIARKRGPKDVPSQHAATGIAIREMQQAHSSIAMPGALAANSIIYTEGDFFEAEAHPTGEQMLRDVRVGAEQEKKAVASAL